MSHPQSRRLFLRTATTAGAALGLSDLAAFLPLSPATADEGQVTPELIRFSDDIEPVVRLIEETPREQCVAAMVEQLRKGLPYRQFLAAQYLAAIRAAKWHGGIHGYDHSAYVVHSAHQLALDLPATERLLPPFLALNHFKVMQEVYPKKPGTTTLTGTLPSAENATAELHSAMREWEPDRAERAVVALVRSQGTPQVLEPLWAYAGRDWGFIGHLAILVANSCRLLETIGWQHAEHVLRYVVAALAGWGKQHADEPDVRPYWANLKRIEKAAGHLPGDWAASQGNAGLTKDLVVLLRNGQGDEACDVALRSLTERKAQAGAIWDAVHLAAGELVLRSKPFNPKAQTNGDALHANTAMNALHYAFRSSTLPDTRLLLVLQALAWMPMYREISQKKKLLAAEPDITALTAAKLPDSPDAAIEEILATRTAQPLDAGRMASAFAQRHGIEPLLRAARRLLPAKSSGDPHDIKFHVAICEDLQLISPTWRPHMVAPAVFSFWGSECPDLPVIHQTREALGKL